MASNFSNHIIDHAGATRALHQPLYERLGHISPPFKLPRSPKPGEGPRTSRQLEGGEGPERCKSRALTRETLSGHANGDGERLTIDLCALAEPSRVEPRGGIGATGVADVFGDGVVGAP